ncbi:MAG: molybdopterin molybdotransferase MoeA [Methylococcales bacterium]|jgi:molybdopterin molybdotransferase|nr:molybdopterin molybdotransferase MoeA [Methylococcales bacterium]MBT7443271.1 molybdopterin molybdotransferase MoeA [Methylococcales bacterium]
MSDPCSSPELITLDEAIHKIIDAIEPLTDAIRLPLRDCLNGTLAEDVQSIIQVPPFTNSAMDGYAIRFADYQDENSVFTVIGTAFAGRPFNDSVAEGQCARIMTGAVVPEGADTVIMQEHVSRTEQHIHITVPPKNQANVRYAGEDVQVGDVVLNKGTLLRPSHIGLLASLGIAEVTTIRKPRIAFFSTGDELIPLGQALAEGQIYDSNRYAIHSLLTELGAEILDMGVIPDERDAVESAFKSAMNCADILLTSGGVSVGEADYVTDTLNKVGQVNFWRLAIKPGKPLAFGHLGDTLFFGLPGNPVSAMATFYEIVLPGIRKRMGQPFSQRQRFHVRLTDKLKKAPGRLEFQRGVLSHTVKGELVVGTTGKQGSHMMTSMAQANCFILLDQESSGAEVGEMVQVEPFYGML